MFRLSFLLQKNVSLAGQQEFWKLKFWVSFIALVSDSKARYETSLFWLLDFAFSKEKRSWHEQKSKQRNLLFCF